MGQYALLAVLAVMTIGAVVLFNAQKTAQAADDDLTAYHEDRFSRELALVGLKRTELRLSQNPGTWSLKATDDAAAQSLYGAPTTTYTKGRLTGTYTVTYDQYVPKTGTTPALAYVTARGVYDGQRFTVKAVYEQGQTDLGLPPQYRQSIVANERLYLNGNVEISGPIHTNDCLDSSGNSFNVYGSGTYTGCEGANDARFSAGLAQSDSIHVPEVVMPNTFDHRTAANTNVSLSTQTTTLTTAGITAALRTGGGNGNGNGGGNGGTSTPTTFTVTGHGTQADPYVLVVQGNLTLDGDIRLLGHIRIYSTGSITVAGNTQLAPVTGTLPDQFSTISQTMAWRDANLPNGSTIGLFARGDVTLSGNCTIVAHVYANGEVNYSGGGHRIVLGGITTGSPLEVRGNAQIVYTQANTTVVTPGGNTNTPDGVRLASYREWATR